MDPEAHLAGDESYFGIGVGGGVIEKLIHAEVEIFLLRGGHVRSY